MDPELNAWNWLVRVFAALALAALALVAVWTVIQLPGRAQDPGLGPNREDPQQPGGSAPDEDGSRDDDERWRGGS
ncbi:MAG TPA: hypothetical protein VLA43_03370 [Longimicrobiales bacterium]|jgi:hypothetical protein|nr:hypothetical protein [Longimicrobiales bacterium]